MLLAACTSTPVQSPVPDVPIAPQANADWASWLAWDQAQALPASVLRPASRWQAVRWADLPGVAADDVHAVWSAWMRSCERSPSDLAPLCSSLRPLGLATEAQRVAWLVSNWQPYQVTTQGGQKEGLLTGYFEPVMRAVRQPDAQHTVPLYATPRGWRSGQSWFTRQQAQQDPQAMAALAGRELLWLADPIDALMLQIQGSGRMLVREVDGREHAVRLAFAGHNGQPYQSVARWLLDRGEIRSGTWEAIRAWALQNAARVQEMLWANPRMVFFREEALDGVHAEEGPRGAQGVPLTPMRSIAVDRASIPYGTPVWLSTQGPTLTTQRWVMAQDTGGAIRGAVRADFFAGWGDDAHALASGLKQPLQLWVLWPRGVQPPTQ